MNYRLRRPTAPIDYEPPPLAPDDSIYPGSDEEEPLEEQEAQRRRIQFQAQHYLRGGQLFILSAQLCGPFDGGWVNPWTGKRKRGAQNNGPAIDNGRVQVGGDIAGVRQECESMTMPETTRPSRGWRNRLNAIRTEILETRSSSPTLAPAQKSPDGVLSTVTKLTPFAEDLHLLPQPKTLLAFKYLSSNREDGGGDLKVEEANSLAKAPEEMLRMPSFSRNATMQELKSNSGNLSARDHEVTPARRLHKFNKKRREINQANNLCERDNISRGPSTILPVLSNETHSVEVRGQPGPIPPQTPPQKRRLEENPVSSNADGECPVFKRPREANNAIPPQTPPQKRRLEENPVSSNADGECPVFKRPREANNANEAITDTDSPFNVTNHREDSTGNPHDAMINAASPFNVPDHSHSSPPKSKPSPFSTIGSRSISVSTKDGRERPQLQP